MATISSYDSASIGMLFSSLNNNRNSNSTSLLGSGTDLLGINYSDYATIKSGSYYKLMKAYYATDASDEVKQAVSQSTSTSKDSTETLTKIESASDDMKESAERLLEKGSKSVFETERVTGEDGKVTTKYDTDAIYGAVNEFVKDYNNLLDEASDSNVSNISGVAERMERLTKSNEKLLSSVGITINKDNRLELDADTFKKADMTVVKGLFNETGGYGYQASAQTSMIGYYAKNEAAKSNTYTNSGNYNYNYNTGSMYNMGI